jgi:alpha,alpha-trehalase
MSGPAARREAHAASVAHIEAADTLSPADRYQELFVAVQSGRVFADSKTFVDYAPRRPPQDILTDYRERQGLPDFDLAAFVQRHFEPPALRDNHYTSDPEQPLAEHIDGLWNVLTRQPEEHPAQSSLLPLPHAYVVPGGRFGELYYWDSYFTMLGLAESGRHDLLRAMADNFAYLIDVFGHVPNGNRSYYLSRSQPPVFALMVELFETHGICRALKYLPQLREEHAWWMQGADDLRPGEASGHCVRLDDGSLLNRYWDSRDTPREEAYREDVATAARSNRPAHEVYRDLRAAAASGWDFSSRWCDRADDLSSIRTTALLPVDLNSLLHRLESQIAQLSATAGEEIAAQEFSQRASARSTAIQRYLWNAQAGAFFDFDWRRDRPSEALSAATSMPLFVGIATPPQAQQVAAVLRTRLLEPGGLATSEIDSGQQWDRPNGWAPLQWLAIHGLRKYGQRALATDIASRWLEMAGNFYRRESKLVEKYALGHAGIGVSGGDGGEYPLQDGFGWTNGVTRKLLHEHPAHAAHAACGGTRRH